MRRQGIDVEVDFTELHASEFHDGTSFLFRQRRGLLLGDGGSYGRFARTFLASPAPVGTHAAVIGLERLADVVSDTDTPNSQAADIAVLAAPETAALNHADQLTATLRCAGIAVWDLVLTQPIRRHLRDMGNLAIPYSVIIGPRELSSANYTVRERVGDLHIIRQDRLADWLVHR